MYFNTDSNFWLQMIWNWICEHVKLIDAWKWIFCPNASLNNILQKSAPFTSSTWTAKCFKGTSYLSIACPAKNLTLSYFWMNSCNAWRVFNILHASCYINAPLIGFGELHLILLCYSTIQICYSVSYHDLFCILTCFYIICSRRKRGHIQIKKPKG